MLAAERLTAALRIVLEETALMLPCLAARVKREVARAPSRSAVDSAGTRCATAL
jgi:hypothetical protein